ncbi:hypothetical protein WJF09_001012 [Klebsiella pneumoniae]|uniref:hypothetical protein n=2 Tax=Klebsiella pneumoniae TaxID=573 RepID=UPI000C7DCC47|nr:hypothetical protein [Klebsiella pneumoniae]MCQ0675287.1 hypothetical protein [Klebsiella pneumoniae]PLI75566.1 hypothetical protein B6J52_01295 [Klebsiella pneumoniae]PXI83236.1 hypothetical protein DMR04_01245 [Klebsiella pneumoniae]PYZ50114.1 hypothetical protein DNK74_05700 [Klebsiella pneumoniae]CAF2454742.1 hypothetical protein AI2850V1_1686 [Klebsiella pneumoniae]
MMKKSLLSLALMTTLPLLNGCDDSLSQSDTPYYTTVFQCSLKDSDTGWCFSTPSRIYSTDYSYVGKGRIQDYLVPGGHLCVANTSGCASVNVNVDERK